MILKLIEKRKESADVNSYVFGYEEEFFWEAGQYMRYQIPNPNADERGIMRYFTNSAAPFEGHVQITTRLATPISTFKQDLDKMALGTEVLANGPFGKFTLEKPVSEYVFIAGGIGITPFRAMLLELDHKKIPFNITLLYGNRTPDAVFKKDFAELAKRNPNFKVFYAIGDQFIDQPFIEKNVPDFSTRVYYISGPEPMVKGIEGTLHAMAIKEGQIMTDYFPGYDGI